MKITNRLIGDHKTFRKMMREIELIIQTTPEAHGLTKLRRLVELFKDHLVIHAWAEDRFFYPPVREKMGSSGETTINEVFMDQLDNEHKTIDGTIDQLEVAVKKEPMEREWEKIFDLFSTDLKSHIKKEEDELFPESEKILGTPKLEDLSAEAERHRSDAPRIRIHSRAS